MLTISKPTIHYIKYSGFTYNLIFYHTDLFLALVAVWGVDQILKRKVWCFHKDELFAWLLCNM